MDTNCTFGATVIKAFKINTLFTAHYEVLHMIS